MPLRSRLAMLVATAVAVAVAAAAVVCWFVVRNALINSLDDALSSSRVPEDLVLSLIDQDGQCRHASIVTNRENNPNPFKSTVQVVDRKGNSCVISGQQSVEVA